jgi:hypothetical protein
MDVLGEFVEYFRGSSFEEKVLGLLKPINWLGVYYELARIVRTVFGK